MSDSELPPESVPPSSPSSPSSPPEGRDARKRRLEGVIPEIVRRAVELGVEKARESPDNLKQLVNDLKLPKDIAHYVFQQIDETKNGLFRVVAKEIRDFLEHTNFAGELQKILTTVQFEVNTTIRFAPNDGRKPNKKGPTTKGGQDPDKGSEGQAPEGAPEAPSTEPSADDGEPSSDASSERTRLPRPELKTAVHVRREERDRRRRSDLP